MEITITIDIDLEAELRALQRKCDDLERKRY